MPVKTKIPEFNQLIRESLKRNEFSRNEPRGYHSFVEWVRVPSDGIPFLDVFSGAGGSSLGMVWAGFRPILAIDSDRYAAETYKSFFKDRLRFDDLSIINERIGVFIEKKRHTLERFREEDGLILVGCPPCQGFSTSGRKGIKDPRNDLVFEYLRMVRIVRPLAVIFENVFGMRSFKRYYQGLIGGLRRLGYSILFGIKSDGSPDIVNSAYYGVPQIRRRVLIVATRSRKLKKNFAAPLPFRFPRSWLTTHGYSLEEVEAHSFETVREWIGDLPPLRPGEVHPSIPNHRAPALKEVTLRRISVVPKDGGSLKDAPEEYWIPCHRKSSVRKKFRDVLGRLKWDEPAVTIKASFSRPTTGRYVHPEQDRSLSIREGARLQTFPDDFEFPNYNTIASRLIGNAFPPRLSLVWGRALREAIERADLV